MNHSNTIKSQLHTTVQLGKQKNSNSSLDMEQFLHMTGETIGWYNFFFHFFLCGVVSMTKS